MENFFIKGHYFKASIKNGIAHLLYPMPEELGLGVHLTIDLDGRVRFGPDTKHVYDINYRQEVDTYDFYKKVALNFRVNNPESLQFDYAGIRPKIKINNTIASDFIFFTEKDHGMKGMISLHAIDSPGLTSCLAIAEKVVRLL